MDESTRETPLMSRGIQAYAQAVHVLDPLRAQSWDRLGLSMAQIRLLILLRYEDLQMLSDLADQLHVSRATVTNFADRLADLGLVERVPDAHDRRVVRVTLTNAGREALSQAAGSSHAFLISVFEVLGEEKLAHFASLLEDFSEAAETVIIRAESPFTSFP